MGKGWIRALEAFFLKVSNYSKEEKFPSKSFKNKPVSAQEAFFSETSCEKKGGTQKGGEVSK